MVLSYSKYDLENMNCILYGCIIYLNFLHVFFTYFFNKGDKFMSLYTEWNGAVVTYVKTLGEDAFWDEYSRIQNNLYESILSNPAEITTGKLIDLANKFQVSTISFIGFLDSLNDNLYNPLLLEELSIDSEIELHIDFEKLYMSMLDLENDTLHTMPCWQSILTLETRKQIVQKYCSDSNVKIHGNKKCLCGSGLKYKQCCGL